MTALLVGLCLWLEPVRYSVQLGQINLLILAVVVADLLGAPERKWAGVGIGMMAGIKLTPVIPVIFLIYLALIGRRRAALIGTTTLAATVALGFAVLPRDSASYWFGGKFTDPQRISPDPTLSSSVRGPFLRLHYPGALGTTVVIAVAVACLGVAVIAWRRGQPVLGSSVVGLAGAAASPFSWSHHWVWFVPLIVHLGYRWCVLGSRTAGWAMWLLWAATAGWLISPRGRTPASGLVAWRAGGPWNNLLPSGYVFVLVVAATASAMWLWRLATRGRARRSSGGLAGDESGNSPSTTHHRFDRSESIMIVLGVILLLIGYFTGLSLLYTIGGILVVVGVVLWLLGAVGQPIGGRKVWY